MLLIAFIEHSFGILLLVTSSALNTEHKGGILSCFAAQTPQDTSWRACRTLPAGVTWPGGGNQIIAFLWSILLSLLPRAATFRGPGVRTGICVFLSFEGSGVWTGWGATLE